MRYFRWAPMLVVGLGLLLVLSNSSVHLSGLSGLGCVSGKRSDNVHVQRPARAVAGVLPVAGCQPAAHYILQPELLPSGLPGRKEDPIHLTFATASVDELLTNWAAHVRQLQLAAVVTAMDQTVMDRCPALRIHCLPSFDVDMEAAMQAEAGKHGQNSAASVNIRGNPALFISLGARKVAAILMLLQTSGRDVIISDVDVVWH